MIGSTAAVRAGVDAGRTGGWVSAAGAAAPGPGDRGGRGLGPAAGVAGVGAAEAPGAVITGSLGSSMTRAGPDTSSSGTFHSKASIRPVTGDTGSQRSDTNPSAVQAG